MSKENMIYEILSNIGEDPTRDGLQKTPSRVIKSWTEIYAGYNVDIESLFTIFKKDNNDSMVVLKNIEMYSMCEHHMLPFFGKAHVAYVPKDSKVIGISKLARLVEAFSRRLQIQERIGEQVTNAIMTYLKPEGAACIIEAQHMCMTMRGVNKQNSVMVTSSVKGVFLTDQAVRSELMNLIKL